MIDPSKWVSRTVEHSENCHIYRYMQVSNFAAAPSFKQKFGSDNPGMQIGHELLAAANQADQAAIPVLVSDRKMWLRHAAKLFTQSSSIGCAIAAR